MFNEFNHPVPSLLDWNTFRKEFSRSDFDQIIERHEACLPDWFLPFARGVAVPSDALLGQVGYRPGMQRPHGWGESNDGFFRRSMGSETTLIVRQCGDLDLWTVERWNGLSGSEVDEVLVFHFGATPIFTRDPIASMLLASHCHLKGPLPRFRWFKGPADPEAAAAIARRRQLDETLA